MLGDMGYEVITVRCGACGHIRHLPPEKYARPRHFVCKRCETRTHEVRSVWVEGGPPDNVVATRRGRA